MKKIFVTALAFLLLFVCISATGVMATNPVNGQFTVLKPVNLASSPGDGEDMNGPHAMTYPATPIPSGRSTSIPAGNGDYTFEWAVPSTVGISLPWGITTDRYWEHLRIKRCRFQHMEVRSRWLISLKIWVLRVR